MRKRILKRIFISCISLGILGCLAVLGINGLICLSTAPRIISTEEAAQLQQVDCILVLGCQVKADGVPSHMLEDRLRRGVALYEAGAAPKLLMSGDHGRVQYNEVETMKNYAMDAGIPSEDVFMDHAGFSTYESLYRARDVFQAKRIIIVSQKYHLYRALHIAKALGLEAWGVDTAYRSYYGQATRDIRELLARVKDFGTGILKPKPTYLGDVIPISGNGDLTND